MSEQTSQKQSNNPQEVDRLRDILFGAYIRDYEQRFQVLQRDQARLQEEIDRLNTQLADQEKNHQQRLQSMHKEMRESDDSLREELRQRAQSLQNDKVDRINLGDLFIGL